MKTLKQAKIGDTVTVVKLHGEGRCQAPNYGHGHYQGRHRFHPKGCPSGRSHGSDCPRL